MDITRDSGSFDGGSIPSGHILANIQDKKSRSTALFIYSRHHASGNYTVHIANDGNSDEH